jgi:hypothetical protein
MARPAASAGAAKMKQVYDILTALKKHLGRDVLIDARLGPWGALVFAFRWKQDGQKKEYRYVFLVEFLEEVETHTIIDMMKRKLDSLEIKPEPLK